MILELCVAKDGNWCLTSFKTSEPIELKYRNNALFRDLDLKTIIILIADMFTFKIMLYSYKRADDRVT